MPCHIRKSSRKLTFTIHNFIDATLHVSKKKPNSRNPEASNARIYFASVLFFARNGRQLNERKRNKRDFYGPDRGIE